MKCSLCGAPRATYPGPREYPHLCSKCREGYEMTNPKAKRIVTLKEAAR